MKTIIEIHALQNFAPSNLNRDDTGAPKDALFGGTRRARISSQCIKRAVRQHFKHKMEEGFLGRNDLAVRTKRVYEAIADLLEKKDRDRSKALEKAKIALSYIKLKPAEDGRTQYLLFIGRKEIGDLAETIHENWESIVPTAEESDKSNKRKGKKTVANSAPENLKEKVYSIFNGGKAVDVALFGRMIADMPEKNQNAACQVAHAISTHAVDREFDFYTAVDDRKPEDNQGADMMGTVEFNSACFYRYAVVDWDKLVSNLQYDNELAAKGLRAFIEGFIVVEPTGKQNTFAAHNPPEFLAVSVRRNTAPRSLANAFETAVRVKTGQSLIAESAGRLSAKATALDKLYGAAGNSFFVAAEDLFGAKFQADGLGQKLDSVKALVEWALSEVTS
jgi:CRISPR system Cascade subunit CasC